MQTDNANCGDCNIACTSPSICVNGSCQTPVPTCSSEQKLCPGGCKNIKTDNVNCGDCGVGCTLPATCVNGACKTPEPTCSSAQKLCSGSCKDIKTDGLNCGECGVGCAAPSTCVNGACKAPEPTCTAPGRKLCPGGCKDTNNDNANCGDCGVQCPYDSTCSGAVCGCPNEGDLLCENLSAMPITGGCVSRLTDSQNCGACGNVCTGGKSCVDAECKCGGEKPIEKANGQCVANDNDNCGFADFACDVRSSTCKKGSSGFFSCEKFCQAEPETCSASMPCCKYTNRKCYTAPGASNSVCTDPQNIVCPAETPVKSPSGDCVASNDDNCGTFGVKCDTRSEKCTFNTFTKTDYCRAFCNSGPGGCDLGSGYDCCGFTNRICLRNGFGGGQSCSDIPEGCTREAPVKCEDGSCRASTNDRCGRISQSCITGVEECFNNQCRSCQSLESGFCSDYTPCCASSGRTCVRDTDDPMRGQCKGPEPVCQAENGGSCSDTSPCCEGMSCGTGLSGNLICQT
ncbi:hypothetical protein Slin14017_G062590 [Septoria linicola]|nr:hypothetical protein Slin14017_G062590 [Septoria linicola]